MGTKCDRELDREVSYDEGKQVSFSRLYVSYVRKWVCVFSLQRPMACNTLKQVQKQIIMLMK